MATVKEPSAFRDPSGFVFTRDGTLYRQINTIYREDWDAFMASGLVPELTDASLFLPFAESDAAPLEPEKAYKILAPERIGFISYPYEWSFSMLQDAGLATLDIALRALQHGMILKDASAFNIQFLRGKPVLMDTLSFERYTEGEPWTPYRQFCEHFLAPLAVMAFTDIRLSALLRPFLGGMPLDLASKLLPQRTKVRFGLMTHIHLHALSQRRYAGRAEKQQQRKMKKRDLVALLENLRGTLARLSWKPQGTEWADYYEQTNYTNVAAEAKSAFVRRSIAAVHPGTVWDLGANTGVFSRLSSEQKIDTIAFDIDPAAVEQAYRDVRRRQDAHLLPLLMDFRNPSPDLGWAHEERKGLITRGPADLALALALVHHLAIGNNVPLGGIAQFFSRIARNLVVEFVPKEDSQAQRLLATREDIFPAYTQDGFEAAFTEYFHIEQQETVPESRRTLYHMKRKQS